MFRQIKRGYVIYIFNGKIYYMELKVTKNLMLKFILLQLQIISLKVYSIDCSNLKDYFLYKTITVKLANIYDIPIRKDGIHEHHFKKIKLILDDDYQSGEYVLILYKVNTHKSGDRVVRTVEEKGELERGEFECKYATVEQNDNDRNILFRIQLSWSRYLSSFYLNFSSTYEEYTKFYLLNFNSADLMKYKLNNDGIYETSDLKYFQVINKHVHKLQLNDQIKSNALSLEYDNGDEIDNDELEQNFKNLILTTIPELSLKITDIDIKEDSSPEELFSRMGAKEISLNRRNSL